MEPKYATPDLREKAHYLRRNMTQQESLLWQKLRCKRICNVRFHRQKPYLEYVLDFYCPKARLAVEVDGAWHDLMHDRSRDGHLKSHGILTLRFTNKQVEKEMGMVLKAIRETVAQRFLP